MDRQHLATWSADLSDADFAAALACLGCLVALSPGRSGVATEFDTTGHIKALGGVLATALDAGRGRLDWCLPTPRGGRVTLPDAADCAAIWRRLQQRGGEGPRLALRAPKRQPWRLLGFIRWLAQPAVGAASVFVADLFAADGRNDWRWPFSIAVPPDDPLAPALAALQASQPSDRPFRFASTTAADARAEILVVGAGIAEALSRGLAARLRLRCCLLVVVASGREDAEAAEPLLRALVERFAAEGAAVLDSGLDGATVVAGLQTLAAELSRNQPLDLALARAFGPRVIALLNADLLALSRLESAVDDLSLRLRQLPPETPIPVSAAAAAQLGMSRALQPGEAEEAAPAAAELAASMAAARGGFRFDRESAEAAAVAELAPQVRAAEAGTRPPRHIQQRSLSRRNGRLAEIRNGYVRGETVTLRLHIGPRERGRIAAATAFPEDRLPPTRDAHRLQLVLHEPRQFAQPLQAEITLPREGPSDRAEFVFTPRHSGEFCARLAVLHRGRVLQTVLLRTRVASRADALQAGRDGISLDDETQVRHDWSDLGSRRAFDLALVLNHTPQGQPRLTGVAGKRAWASDLSGISEPLRDINALLSQVALQVDEYAGGLDQGENPKLLASLARIGADLYSQLYLDQLQPLATGGFDAGSDAVTHIQVIATRSDAVVPLEFIYDLPPPDEDAAVCPQYRAALAAGKCPAKCAGRKEPQRYVCPLGFWGLRKVIERHYYSPQVGKPDGAEVVIQAEPAAGRERLELGAGALLAYSREVDAKVARALSTRLTRTLKKKAAVAADWKSWKQKVEAAPSLLVAFPHNDGSKQGLRLEIGGDFLPTLRLPAAYVRPPTAPPPLVFLLGCDTAGSAEDYATHIRYFRQAGAAAVVSTIATVFGPHAVAVGDRILARLLARRGKGEARLGEILRDAKREALGDSLPMALCVVAFGDADWRL